jgi:hypothetical protein
MRINGYRKGQFHKGNASRLGKLGVAARAKKRMESPHEEEPRRVPAGEMLGVLQWHSADGQVRRWTIKQGQRMNGIQVKAKGKNTECGWDHLFRSLRKKLATPKRIFA